MAKPLKTINILIHDSQEARALNGVQLPNKGFSTKWLSKFLIEQFNLHSFLLHDGGVSIGEEDGLILVEALSEIPKTLPLTDVWEVPENARPWQKNGWISSVQLWIDNSLEGYSLTLKDFDSISTYDAACILRISSQDQSLAAYFKVAESNDEARITVHLVKYYPDLIPKVLAYDIDRAWLLSQDEGQRLSEISDVNIWCQAISQLANFHATAKTDILLNLETPCFSFETLLEETERFLASNDDLTYWNISENQQMQLQEIMPRLQEAHQNILALGLQECCCHGDAQPMNALWNSNTTKWFDWSEACVAHPLTDIGWTLAWLAPKRKNLALEINEEVMKKLWEHYIDTAGLPHARHLMLDAMRIALIHRILAYHQKYRHWQGTVAEWKPQYVSYYLKLLFKVNDLYVDYPEEFAK